MGIFIPDHLFDLSASFQSDTFVLGIKAKNIAHLHIHAVRIPELLDVGAARVNGKFVQEITQRSVRALAIA
jgi:hypothetical protein